MTPLSEKELQDALTKLPNWEVQDDMLITAFEFDDFAQTMHFANHIADIADQQQHHPRMIIEFDLLQVELSTHDAGDKVTQKDIDLAHAIDHLEEHHEHMH